MKLSLLSLLWLLAFYPAVAGSVEEFAGKIAPLIHPTNLATLGPRQANPRVQKVTYWLAMAKKEHVSPAKVADAALASVKMTNALAVELTKGTMLRNLSIAEKLGCVDDAGLSEMRNGRAATVRRGSSAGDQLSVDHIIPFAVAPELDHVMANLELMPQGKNSRKNAKIGTRQWSLATKFHRAGLLSTMGLWKVRWNYF